MAYFERSTECRTDIYERDKTCASRHFSCLSRLFMPSGSAVTISNNNRNTNGRRRENRQAMVLKTVLLLSCICSASTQSIIWASNGGGWRSMATVMGYANVFYQAGLIEDDKCAFEAIATNSGASWFNTQFFYSPVFFNATTQSTPDELYDFVLDWMESFEALFDRNRHNTEGWRCGKFRRMLQRLHVAEMFSCMFETATANYGDPAWIDRPATPENRLPALQNTNMYLQSALVPTYRHRRRLLPDTLTYWGPTRESTSDELGFATNLAMHMAVKTSGLEWKLAVEDEDLPLTGYLAKAPRTFKFDDWRRFHLYPAKTGSVYTTDLPRRYERGIKLRDFFGGQPTTLQAALSGSMATSDLDASGPSTFAQRQSVERYKIRNGNSSRKHRDEQRLVTRSKLFYRKLERLNEFGICTQYPNKCDERDAFLGDGGSTDGTSVALAIAQHQASGVDLNTPLKVIVTLTYFVLDNDSKFLAYFDTDFNQDIPPGEFIWFPSTVDVNNPQPNPWRSPQIFAESMDQETLDDLRAGGALGSVNASAFQLSLTTVDNPSFHVTANQPVNMLVLTYFGSTPTFMIGDNVKAFKGLTAQISKDLASDTDLLAAVQDFMLL